MHKIDLITGFLGSGKTTFISKYAAYLMGRGERIGILENDFGAINVDRVLLADLLGDKCGMEMVVGGDTLETHRRRMKTKLIALAMNGYDRVIIEPSGIFDVDELFDLLYEDPLDRMYEMGSVITLADAVSLQQAYVRDFSRESRYLSCAQSACAGRIVISKVDVPGAAQDPVTEAVETLNGCLTEFGCKRRITPDECLAANLNELTDDVLEKLSRCGYHRASHVKLPVMAEGDYESLFAYDLELEHDDLVSRVRGIFDDPGCGRIFRIKGYMNVKDRGWTEINATSSDSLGMQPAPSSENVLIVIGENVNADAVRKWLPVR